MEKLCYKFNDARILVAIFKEYQFYLYSTDHMTERYVQSTLISDHCASSTNDSLFWQWYWGQILDMSRLWPISTAWSGLTQNTLDLSILNTDLAPDCHVVGWCFFYCIPFCLVGMASFCKLCKRQFEVNSFGFFMFFFYFENEYRPLSITKYDKTLGSELDVKCSSTIYTVLHLAVYWETMSSLFKF